MKSTTARKLTTLGVGLSLLSAGLVAASPASATTCYVVLEGFIFSYTCYNNETPICYKSTDGVITTVTCPVEPPPPPPPPSPPPPLPPPPSPPSPPVNVPTPIRVATKLGLLTKAGTASGPTTVSVAAKLTDLAGRARTSIPVNLCWRALTASRESCVARTTNSAGVASTSVKVSTATTVRAVANATATTGASSSASAVVRVRPKVAVAAGVRTLSVSLKPVTRVKVKLQKKVGSRYVNIHATYTSTRGTARFTKLTKGSYYRVYVYASGGRNAVYSGARRVR